MDIYLLKFSACLFVFWLVYVLILEGQNMHQFKRFYLIGACIAALIIPLLSITYYIEPIASNFEAIPQYIPIESATAEPQISEAPGMALETVLWYVYGLGVLLFSTRFVSNLVKLYKSISKHKKVTKAPFVYVLLKAYRVPHSFFKYIFLNQLRYETGTIPKEVLLHEETHARQLHSLDIILLEVFQIAFWFHPLVYILKRHVKLNHEFLADEAVLNEGTDTKNYQNILLQFSSPDSYRDTPGYQLSSAINYSSSRLNNLFFKNSFGQVKKRFTVMKTQTSKTKQWLSTLLLVPVIALLFYSFAERKEVVKPAEKSEANRFLVTVEKSEKGIELKCEIGCQWSHLVLKPNTESYIINDYGFSEGKTLDSDKFAFEVIPTASGANLNGLTGTKWTDLGLVLFEDKKQAISQHGMAESTSLELEKNNTDLFKRAEINYYTKQFFTVKTGNDEYVKKRFQELTYEDKVKWVYADAIPYDRIDVTASHFEKAKQSKNYIIKVNGNYISKKELESYKATDFITFGYTPISELADLKETAVLNLVTQDVYDSFVNIMINQYQEVIDAYESELRLSESERQKDLKEIVSTYEFLDYNYRRFTPELVKKHSLEPPTAIPAQIVREVNQSYLDIPILYIDKDLNLFLNDKPTTLETLQNDFNRATQSQDSELILEADGRRIDKSLVNQLMEALGDRLKHINIASGQALIHDSSYKLKAITDQKPVMWILVNSMGHLLVDEETATVSELEDKLKRLAKTDKSKGTVSIQYDKATSKQLLAELKTLVQKYHFEVFTIDAAKIPPPPPPVPPKKTSKGGPNTEDLQEVYNPTFLEYILEMEASGASFYLDGKKISAKKARFIAQNNKGKQTDMLTQKDDNGKYVVKLSTPKPLQSQEKATKEQVATYNKIARHYNTMIAKGGNIRIDMKDVEKLKYIYNLMSDKQRKNADPFPDFPEPPPPPPAPEAPKVKVKEVKAVRRPSEPKPVSVKAVARVQETEVAAKALTAEEKKKLKKRAKVYKKEHPEAVKKVKVKTKDGKVVEVEEVEIPQAELIEVPSPPEPPAPPSPLDFVIKMAKSNAKFYYETEAISSDKAIELLKKNPELNVRAKKTKAAQPIVYISKKPIVIEVKEEKRN